MGQSVQSGEVAAVHTEFLNKSTDSDCLKLYIPFGQVAEKDHQTQTWSQHLVWVAVRTRFEEAIQHHQPLWESGEVFLVRGTSLDLTRLSLRPKHTNLPFEADASALRVVVTISSSVHEYIFGYTNVSDGHTETIRTATFVLAERLTTRTTRTTRARRTNV